MDLLTFRPSRAQHGGGRSSLKIGLAGTCNAQRTGRNVLGDSRTGSRKRTVAQLDRRNEVGIAADEAVVTDLGAVLVIAVVVDNDRAAAEVDALADGCIADIGQVRNLGAVADGGLLQLYKVADAAPSPTRSAGGYRQTDRPWYCCRRWIHKPANCLPWCLRRSRLFREWCSADDRARADLAAGTDVTAGQNGRARSNISVRRNVGAGQIKDLHALFNQAVVDTLHHLDLRHKGGSAVADDVNLVGDSNALLCTGCNSRRNQAVERISAARECLFQHIPGEHGGIAAAVSRQRLTFRVKACCSADSTLTP